MTVAVMTTDGSCHSYREAQKAVNDDRYGSRGSYLNPCSAMPLVAVVATQIVNHVGSKAPKSYVAEFGLKSASTSVRIANFREFKVAAGASQ